MIVFGDQSRTTERTSFLTTLAALLRKRSGTALARHARLVEVLIGLGQVAQAEADQEAETAGRDGVGPAQRTAIDAALAVAALVGRSWSSGLTDQTAAPDEILAGLARLNSSDELILREPEGYACYALYPEAFWQAALKWRGGADTRVIGIRSIGTSLSATVAAALRAPTPVTVRPVGHPFARRLDLGPELAGHFGQIGSRTFAVVDEGPGLSGSSFGAVADRLEQDGVDRSRIVFFPSHANGPGSRASEAHRRRWETTRCFVTTFDEIILAPARPEHALETWVRDLTGPLTAPSVDIAGGRWRSLVHRHEAGWPPADAFAERRKLLLRAENGTFLLKFTGLGRSGRERFAMRRALAAGGFTADTCGWRHGFTVERWREDCRPIEAAPVPRVVLVERLGAYLAFRAAHLPAEGRSGASPHALLAMLVANAGEALGQDAGKAFAAWTSRLTLLQAAAVPVVTDNRLHAWEWLLTPGGRLIKTDAVDHHAGHDLVGCQDIAWDVAGAAVEFDLAPDEIADVVRTIARACGQEPDPTLLQFHRAAYPAFQLGLCTLAAGRNAEPDNRRWRAQAARYAAELAARLAAGAP